MDTSETIFRELFDNIKSGIAVYEGIEGNSDFVFRDINIAGCKITGTSKDDIIGRKVTEVFPGVKELGLFEVFQRVAKSGEPEHHPSKAYKDDKIEIWVDNYVYRLPDGQVVAVFDDLTEQKNVERQLNHAMKMSHDIVQSIQSGLFIYLYREPDSLFLLQANPEAERLTGKLLKDWKGKEFNEIWPAAKESGVTDSFLSAIKTGEPFVTEDLYYEDKTLTGAFRVNVFNLPESRLAVAFEDITERKRAELAREEFNRTLERRVRERTEDLESFAYSVSHDLRAPLRAVNGFAQILRRRHSDDLDEEGSHFVDNIVDASNQMGLLIDDLLKYSRLGRSSLNMREVKLENIFQEITRTLKESICEKKVDLQIAEEMPSVIGDRSFLNQAFMNIINNAVIYSRPGVKPVVRVSHTTEDNHLIVRVDDNGLGIEEEYLDKVFDVFQRLHNQETYPGTGIGLAIVKKAVEMHGGRVHIESTPGEGSSVIVRLPLTLE